MVCADYTHSGPHTQATARPHSKAAAWGRRPPVPNAAECGGEVIDIAAQAQKMLSGEVAMQNLDVGAMRMSVGSDRVDPSSRQCGTPATSKPAERAGRNGLRDNRRPHCTAAVAK